MRLFGYGLWFRIETDGKPHKVGAQTVRLCANSIGHFSAVDFDCPKLPSKRIANQYRPLITQQNPYFKSPGAHPQISGEF